MDKFRETPVEGHDREYISENEGLREACIELIKALEVMCSSFPAPEKIEKVRNRFKYLLEE